MENDLKPASTAPSYFVATHYVHPQNKDLTKTEAFSLMRQGKKIRHRYFTNDEWMTINKDGDILFEDGVVCTVSMFEMDRKGEMWNSGYSLVEEPTKEESSLQKENKSNTSSSNTDVSSVASHVSTPTSQIEQKKWTDEDMIRFGEFVRAYHNPKQLMGIQLAEFKIEYDEQAKNTQKS